jgi:ABC-type cobalt transport system substrate-binding protein
LNVDLFLCFCGVVFVVLVVFEKKDCTAAKFCGSNNFKEDNIDNLEQQLDKWCLWIFVYNLSICGVAARHDATI